MNQLTTELVELLTLEKLEENLFRGISRNIVGKRVFGGQVLGQALRAAAYTTDRPAHSMHAYFLHGGDVGAPIIYQVENLREGKSFVSRQVRALQHGKLIFTAMISFAPLEEGLNYHAPEPDYVAPESLKTEQELKETIVNFLPENVRVNFMRERHVDLRYISVTNPFTPQPEAPSRAHWMKTWDTLPDDPGLHQAIVAFSSDFALMGTGLMPHGISFMTPNLQAASLDHTIYFHQPIRADEWLLHDMDATVTSNARGLNFGRLWQNGELVASTVQEGLMRLRETEER